MRSPIQSSYKSCFILLIVLSALLYLASNASACFLRSELYPVFQDACGHGFRQWDDDSFRGVYFAVVCHLDRCRALAHVSINPSSKHCGCLPFLGSWLLCLPIYARDSVEGEAMLIKHTHLCNPPEHQLFLYAKLSIIESRLSSHCKHCCCPRNVTHLWPQIPTTPDSLKSREIEAIQA